MDTRTSRIELNKLAEEAGRLGKTSHEDIMGFVKAADVINVALDELGDGATLNISKLTTIFGDEAILGTERSLLAVGSVINELSQNCTASAPYLTEFAKRLAGVGNQAGMTVPQIMAFGAVLDSQGQAVEMSATALSKIIMNMFKDTERIASATGMNLEKFKQTLQSSTNEGLLMLLERLHELGNMDVLAPVFKDMGENGARASAVISALAGNIEMLKRQQQEAVVAFDEAASVTKEFNVQNNTVQAGLDKAKKKFLEIAVELGEKLAPVVRHLITSASMTLRLLSTVVSFIGKYKKEIIVLVATMTAYQISVNAAAIKTKVLAGAQIVAKTATAAWSAVAQTASVVTALFSGNLKRAAVQFRILSRMLKTSPVGLAVGALTALVGVLTLWISKNKELNKSQKILADIQRNAAKSAVDEKNDIELLVAAAENENTALNKRLEAMEKLNSVIPDYNAHLDETTGKYIANKNALDGYLDSLVRKYEIEGAKENLAQIGKNIADLKLTQSQLEKELENTNAVSGPPKPATSSGAFVPVQVSGTINAAATRKAIKNQINDIKKRIAGELKAKDLIMNLYGSELLDDVLKKKINPNPVEGDDGVPQVSAGDRFAAENRWREKEQALNRIAYATGEKSYREYTQRMNRIAVEYAEALLKRTDLTENERLNIEADRHESLKKQNDAFVKTSIEDENTACNERMALLKQFFIDGTLSRNAYIEQTERLESEHLQNLVNMTEEGSEQRIRAEQKLRDFEFKTAEKKRRETEKLSESLKKSYFGDSLEERTEMYNRDLDALTQVYNAEIFAARGSAEERLRIEEAFEKAKLALMKKYRLDNGQDSLNAVQKINADITEWMDSDGGKAVMKSFDSVVSGMGGIFSQLSSLVQSELEMKTADIEKRYGKELSLAEGNSYKINKIERKKEKEIARAKNEANRKMFGMQVFQAVAQTAQNAIAAYGSAAAIPLVGYILAPIAASMAVAAGALQIAVIKKQQKASVAQGYAKGGYTKKGSVNEVAGVVHAGEWVASQKLLENPVAGSMVRMLDYAQRTNRIGSLSASDVSHSVSAQNVIAANSSDAALADAVNRQAAAVASYAEAIKLLNKRLDEPFVTINTVTGDSGIKKAQDDYNRLLKNKSPKFR